MIDAKDLKPFAHYTLAEAALSELPNYYRGKVRENYDLADGSRILIASDRISAFDVNLAVIPLKGQVLTGVARYWFNETRDICPNHVIDYPDPNVLVSRKLSDSANLQERRVFDEALLAELTERLPHPAAHTPLNKLIMKEGEGGVFGEMALVDQSPRAASAVAETDCDLLSINRKDFLALVKSNPAFAVALLKGLADRLRFMTSHH